MKKLKFLTVVTGAFLFSSIALAAPQIGLRDLQSGTAGLRDFHAKALQDFDAKAALRDIDVKALQDFDGAL
ncbi:hypothetical protein [Coxiella burnetii]|uniref:Pentapeptide repeat-containing protein n=2 Tax=Coxiella burnetii TaxID=777 RepID=Q83EW2_COXBU|nr:hypothetical protein [Coxiella burnetii]NP_819242.1 hypothetical protein CBU_0196 [Coxiella burnetii RSA 493]AAO89756.1 hypothetical protein CBU_0196 [Coxiella burnetii RSA 493]ABS78379.1 hypothetical protein CBUD_1900 [Coxiella burnetii Dugway 5J108-111]ABX77213.1 hypothetical protein COXBURSA331_A0290 [Coxiella burnetii RSA 331]ACJ19676.1 hypothetical exported protein [Coxiella burnetii CbuK_Q154]AIT62700.1 putative exported protein [Coxiella burnetii str. Namibia]